MFTNPEMMLLLSSIETSFLQNQHHHSTLVTHRLAALNVQMNANVPRQVLNTRQRRRRLRRVFSSKLNPEEFTSAFVKENGKLSIGSV